MITSLSEIELKLYGSVHGAHLSYCSCYSRS